MWIKAYISKTCPDGRVKEEPSEALEMEIERVKSNLSVARNKLDELFSSAEKASASNEEVRMIIQGDMDKYDKLAPNVLLMDNEALLEEHKQLEEDIKNENQYIQEMEERLQALQAINAATACAKCGHQWCSTAAIPPAGT
eukprot:jgi/Mesen1/6996/ME000365S06135